MMLGVALAGVGACVEERPRPGPPVLQIAFDRDSIQSPDTLTGTVQARDPDGLDSIWLTVNSSRTGEDGLLQGSFVSRFRSTIPAGLTPGLRLPVRVEARDLSGFSSTLDTIVVIIP